MIPEAQRIAIAKACGWKIWASYDDGSIFYDSPENYSGGNILARYPDLDGSNKLPDYLNDLNAMHEAEKKLTTDELWDYCDLLDGLNGGHIATAAQRAEAFLRTLNLWTDEQ